ncbi:CHAD domain-containing protein [Mycobacterium sp. djl-10]|nr:CHAD domain-containing protein [Mycobacterium sp. djl-10]
MPTAKPTRHKEIERKFDVTESTVSPSFDGLNAVARVELSPAESLDAVYYDTAGHDLAARKITLRRRTGGGDEGWHLKLPAGADARTEVRVPLDAGTDTVPADLLDVVLAIVRDRPLAPVARISTTRHIQLLYGADGVALAEFCDDQVTAWATDGEEQSWREWELELLSPDADPALLGRLGNRLLDAGAAPAASGSKLARVLGSAPATAPTPEDPVHRAVAEQVAQLVEWDRAVRADVWDSVHQMRVTTRKLRSLLKESEESFGLTDDSWVLDELKALAAILGVARDAEVLAERYEKSLADLPAELVRGPVHERLVDGAQKRYAVGHRRSLAAMRTPRYFRLLDALEELATSEPVTTEGAEHKPVTVDSAYKRVRKAARAADEATEDRDEALHRIRKSAKRLRYTASALGADKVAGAAKEIQTLLGDHQDSHVSRAHLLQEAEAAHAAGEDTFTYGLLYQREYEFAEAARVQVEDALAALQKTVRKL